MDKKGQGISMTYIVIAALALVVLVVIILFFTGALERMFTQQKDIVEGATQHQQDIWRARCKLYASLDQEDNWDNQVFEDDEGNEYGCGDSELMGKSFDDYIREKEEEKQEEGEGSWVI